MNAMTYVIGIDLGTSAVKALLVNRHGEIAAESSRKLPLLQERSGWSEQRPEDWVRETLAALAELMRTSGVSAAEIEGISLSGQMHGLVLLDANHRPLRNAILWNDTRTTKQCRQIEAALGDQLLEIARNPALEGFTLPKLLWVKEHEPELYAKAKVFLLPKDYVRYRLTGEIAMDISDAAGTLLLDVRAKRWSETICRFTGVDLQLCPPLLESCGFAGTLLPEAAEAAGLSSSTKVFAGGADNACGAVGAGILQDGAAMCSIGTSGVVLAYESQKDRDFGGKLHFFNHAQEGAYYAMGVTLSAGYSLSWLQRTFAPNKAISELVNAAAQVPAGSGGLLFTPYLTGERTPHADALIRGSWIGLDASHAMAHMVRSVMEGVTFSLNESVELLRTSGNALERILSIGGGAKSREWLQIQADVFRTQVVPLETEQGPGMGAAMIAAAGCGWFDTLSQCADAFLRFGTPYEPDPARAEQYAELFQLYQDVYRQTRSLHVRLQPFRP